MSPLIFGLSKAAEVIVSKNLPACPLYGLTAALQKDATCADLIEYISISHNVGCSSPEMALGLCIASTVSRVVAINKFLTARTQGPEPPAAPMEEDCDEPEVPPENAESKTPPPPGVLDFD